MRKITLTAEKETLLIPLLGKAKEMGVTSPILIDQKAEEIVNQIEYDFSSLHVPEKTNMMMCLRARIIDDLVKAFLEQDGDHLAIHLGCGLDSRYERVGDHRVDWYDIDFPDVIEVRKLFFTESDHYHLIASSVTDERWLTDIAQPKQHTIVIAEGLFMYLREEEIKTLLRRLKDRVGSYTLIFDAFSLFTARKVGSHPSIKKTGAVIRWGVDDPQELPRWGIGLEFIKELYFTDNDAIRAMAPGKRMMFKIADLFPFVKKAQRILVYHVVANGKNATTQ